ncbi:AraC family transcriptional regulator [Bacillus sp. T33-2]|uniref:AraC family transcriptional regulator n=1 Tax=Bacillus sp. T33-2 TaxID=2054168 RepID=UPI0015E0DE7E|nr:AraC family transcriptional regulator [Bacillus sp. T33-2]
MEAMQRLNKCLEYIEDHLDKEVYIDELARLSFYSKYHFQRMFHLLTGFTLADYVRNRRLTVAAQDLAHSDKKIIDVALKYGYETPESFSKAFRKLHGFPPSQVRGQGRDLKAFPRISFQIQIKGVTEMNYRIVDREEFTVLGKGKRVSLKDGTNLKVIPLFWEEVNQNGTSEEICNITGTPDVLGVCMEFNQKQDEMTYFIGGINVKKGIKDGLEEKTVPKATWAVFEAHGAMPDAIQNVWQRIYGEWFPSTGYEHAGGPEFELYPPGNPYTDDYRSEVWIPIKRK